MPTFEYACYKCHSTWEILAFSADDAPECCPDCGSTDIKRQVSLPARPVFKGPGFYETDYKQKGK